MRDILARRREEGTFRELRTPEQDRCFVDFTSNDFLGLGRAADLRHAIEREAARVRQACCTLRDPILSLTETPALECSVMPASVRLLRGFYRYSFDEIHTACWVGRVAYKRQDDKTRPDDGTPVRTHKKSQSHILSSIMDFFFLVGWQT